MMVAETEQHCAYDAWNRQAGVYADDAQNPGNPGTRIMTYTYDGLNRLAVSHDNFYYHYYYNEQWQTLEVRRNNPADGDPEQQYVWDIRYIDAPVVRFFDGNLDGDVTGGAQENDSVLYYANDANMNVTALVDAADGSVVERVAYTAYGKAILLQPDWGRRNNSVVKNWILFAGYRFDDETGLYIVRHRVYDAELGRWGQRDPAAYSDGLNLCAYTASNPIAFADPTGLKLCMPSKSDRIMKWLTLLLGEESQVRRNGSGFVEAKPTKAIMSNIMQKVIADDTTFALYYNQNRSDYDHTFKSVTIGTKYSAAFTDRGSMKRYGDFPLVVRRTFPEDDREWAALLGHEMIHLYYQNYEPGLIPKSAIAESHFWTVQRKGKEIKGLFVGHSLSPSNEFFTIGLHTVDIPKSGVNKGKLVIFEYDDKYTENRIRQELGVKWVRLSYADSKLFDEVGYDTKLQVVHQQVVRPWTQQQPKPEKPVQ